MKWTEKEEKVVKKFLKENLNSSYSEIVKMIEEVGINRSRKAIQHKNNRKWNIPREVKITPPYSGFGEENANWKGGRTKHSSGYVLIYCPKHPRAHNRYVFEHILVIEEKLGHYLERDKAVHHINGIKDDNRPENLEVLTIREHHLKRYPYKLNKKDGLYRGRKVSGGRISFHSDILEKLLDEFYMEIIEDKIIIHLNGKA